MLSLSLLAQVFEVFGAFGFKPKSEMHGHRTSMAPKKCPRYVAISNAETFFTDA